MGAIEDQLLQRKANPSYNKKVKEKEDILSYKRISNCRASKMQVRGHGRQASIETEELLCGTRSG